MNSKEIILKAYDTVADDYASAYINELDNKPFDRMLLNWFAGQVPKDETILEIGSGPGEVSGYLAGLGAKCLGTDASPRMIANAKKYFPEIKFEVQDFFNLTYKDNSFFAVIGFYAIVNLTLQEIKSVFSEIKRVLKPGGIFVFSFHIYENEEKLEINEFLDHKIDKLPFYFLKVEEIKKFAEDTDFIIQDIIIRHPYKDAEYQSKRAYFTVKKR